MIGCGRSDLSPICRLESLERGGKEIAVFDHDVTPLALYEIANDVLNILPKHLPIRQNAVDRLNEAAQTLRPFLMLKRQIAVDAANLGITDLRKLDAGYVSVTQKLLVGRVR